LFLLGAPLPNLDCGDIMVGVTIGDTVDLPNPCQRTQNDVFFPEVSESFTVGPLPDGFSSLETPTPSGFGSFLGLRVTAPATPGTYNLTYDWSRGSFWAEGSLQVHVFARGPSADISVTMSASGEATVGSNYTYTITLKNKGPLSATGVVLTD